LSRYSEKLLKGTVLLSAGSIISLVIAAAGSIIIARLLGPENYGLIGMSMILPNLMLALTDLGINTALTRYSSIRDSSMKTIVVSGLTLKIILSLLSALIVYITAPYVAKALGRPYIEPYIKLLSIFTLASLLYGALNSILIGYGLYALSSISQVILTIIRVSSAVLLVILGYGVTGAILGHVIAWLLTTIPLLVYTLKLIGLPLTISLKSIRELLHYGIPLHLPVVISIPLGQLYYSIMVRVSSDWEIGNLSVAQNFLAPLNAIGGAIGMSLLSILPSLTSSNEMSIATSKVIRITSLIMPALACSIIIVSEPLILTLYGPNYTMSPLYTSLLVLVFLYAPLGSLVWGSYFPSIGRTDISLRISLVGTAIGIPVYVTLTILAGVIGYIVSGLLVGLVQSIYALSIARSLGTRVDLKSNTVMLASSILALTSALPIILIVNNLILEFIIAATVYTIVLALTTPIIAGEDTLKEISQAIIKTKLIGPITASLLNVDIKIAMKIWGLEEKSSK